MLKNKKISACKKKKNTEKDDPYITTYAEIKSKLLADINVKPKIIKLLEDNIGETLTVFISDNAFLDFTQ